MVYVYLLRRPRGYPDNGHHNNRQEGEEGEIGNEAFGKWGSPEKKVGLCSFRSREKWRKSLPNVKKKFAECGTVL